MHQAQHLEVVLAEQFRKHFNEKLFAITRLLLILRHPERVFQRLIKQGVELACDVEKLTFVEGGGRGKYFVFLGNEVL